MKGNLTNRWEGHLKILLRNEKQAMYFAKIFMCHLLDQEVEIDRIHIKIPAGEKTYRETDHIAAVLDLWVLLNGEKRNMEVEICEKQAGTLSQNVFSIRYYCVEAPAILIDSGVTKIRVTVGPEMEDYIRKTRKMCES